MTESHFHDPADMKNMAVLRRNVPESFGAFAAFDASALHAESNVLSRKYLELMAVAVGLTTQCVYCIEGHVRAATQEGATTKEVSETVMIVAALRAGGGFVHGRHALVHAAEIENGTATDPDTAVARATAALRRGAPSSFGAFIEFDNAALKGESNVIPRKETELIAVVVALTTQCGDCIKAHTAAAVAEGATTAELAEVTFVATALRAGAGVAHGMMALKFHLEEAAKVATDDGDLVSVSV
jgi:AhpD family alkylhydroperoxidase